MRGGNFHNKVIVKSLANFFRTLGGKVECEFPIKNERGFNDFVDLFIELKGKRIVCEVELKTSRSFSGLKKAKNLKADLLLVVLPTSRALRAARGRLRTKPPSIPPSSFKLHFSTLGGVPSIVSDFLSIPCPPVWGIENKPSF